MNLTSPRVGVFDFDIVVVGGVGTGDLLLANHLSNFSIKCDANAVFDWDFFDRDDYPIYGGTNRPRKGPVAGPIGAKCMDAKLLLRNATNGTYNVRVFVNN